MASGVGGQPEKMKGWCEARVSMLNRSAVTKMDVFAAVNPHDMIDAIMGVEVIGQFGPVTVNLPKYRKNKPKNRKNNFF